MQAVEPVIDLARLERQTHGDGVMQVEVLALFIAEIERLMKQIEEAATPEIRGDRLQAVASVARNVGARRLASAAQAVQVEIASEAPSLEPLRLAIAETLAYLRQTSGGSPARS
jgi:hypothetical protein